MSTNISHTIIIQAGQSLADIAVQEYGTVEGMVMILEANPGLGISDELTPGFSLIIPRFDSAQRDKSVQGITTQAAPEPATPVQQITITESIAPFASNSTPAIKTIIVQAGQTLADIALQEYGTVEGAILILQANPGLSLTDELTGGRELSVFTNYAVNLVKELVKVEPYGSQLQGMLTQWLALTKIFIGVDGYRIWTGTMAARNAIAIKDSKTIYLVEEVV